MRLVRYFPTAQARSLANFDRRWHEASGDAEAGWLPRADVIERADAYEVTLELPGLTREDVKVSIEDSVLSVSGETKSEENTDNDTYRSIERRYGKFGRTFRLPKGVDADKIGAAFENGLLKLTVPKPVEILPKTVEIN